MASGYTRKGLDQIVGKICPLEGWSCTGIVLKTPVDVTLGYRV